MPTIIPVTNLTVLARQRSSSDAKAVQELAESIRSNGLIHPIVVRETADGHVLVAGERRLQALNILWHLGEGCKCGGEYFDIDSIPCIALSDLSEDDAYEIELEENIRRVDISWQDRCAAVASLYEKRHRETGTPPTIKELTDEIYHTDTGGSSTFVREQLLVSRYLDDPDIAGATSAGDALKLLKRKESLARSAAYGREIGSSFTAAAHTLMQGDCLELMLNLADQSFDVILTDPPYGIDAQEFGDSGGKTWGGHKEYDDSFESWQNLIAEFAIHSYRLAKPEAHAYVFCDIDNYHSLWECMATAGWKCFRTPLIWVNPTANRAPWPQSGPHRRWQMILYAKKGDKPVTKLYSDVITVPSDANLNHHAQKPVALYVDLLRRSVGPGHSVLDCFAGTGTILPAAHELQCKATAIELDPAAYGIAAKRLEELPRSVPG
jgi:site-specific DNA-methyltransferase (adenine-specific)